MSLKVVSFKSLGAVSYSPSIITMAISVAVVASKNDLTLKTGLGFVQGHWKWHKFDRSHASLNTLIVIAHTFRASICINITP